MPSQTEIKATFMDQATFAINEGIKSGLEEPTNEEGEVDWSPYKDLVDSILDGIMVAFNNAELAQKKQYESKSASPTKAKVTKKNKSGSDSVRAPNAYARWISMAAAVRSGKIPGDEVVTIGEHFKDRAAKSAQKYMAVKDDLQLDGKTMTIRELLTALKEVDSKDMAQSAMAWGLVQEPQRQEIALAYVSQ